MMENLWHGASQRRPWRWCNMVSHLEADKNKTSTVRCRYNAVNFLPNPPNLHLIARSLGWDMGCNLWFDTLFYILLQSPQYCMKHRVILDRVITALHYIRSKASYLYNGSSYADKTTSLYQTVPLAAIVGLSNQVLSRVAKPLQVIWRLGIHRWNLWAPDLSINFELEDRSTG